MLTDDEIVKLYWERSQTAIEETDKAYGRYFHYIAYNILCNEEDAKEIVNDTYLKAWNVIPPTRPNPLKAFLGRITRQLAINRLEYNLAKRRGSAASNHTIVLDELQECIPNHNNSSDLTDLLVLKDILNSFIRSLPLETRRVFIKRYWYMQSISDISKDYAISESKVKSILHRTRKKLKQTLEKEEYNI